MKRLTAVLAGLALAAMAATLHASAATPISLVQVDARFALGGFSTLDIGGPGGANGPHEDEPFWIAQQADGKFVVSGKAQNPRTGNIDFAILRYTENGLLDPSFGWGGIVLVDFLGARDEGMSVAIQPDGKIVVAGLAGRLNGNSDFGLVRLNPDGSRDATFGWNGIVMTDFFGHRDQALALAILDDGAILAGGYASRSASDSDFALARYHANGARDPSFGIAGLSTANFWGRTDAIYKMEVQEDGLIVGAGVATRPDGTTDFAVGRFLANGVPDRSFGLGGFVATDFLGGNDVAYALLTGPNGSVIVGGVADNPFNGSSDLALVKYNQNGSIDTSFAVFGDPGKLTMDFAGDFDQALWLVQQPDGKIVAIGHSKDAERDFNFAITRVTADGEPDPGFGTGGMYITDFFAGPDGAHAGVLLEDGALVVVGDAFDPATDSDDFAIIKYRLADPSWIAGVVSALPADAFTAPSRQSELVALLTQADTALLAGDAAAALLALQSVEARVSACSGGSEQWLVDCDAQQRVRGLVLDTISRLSHLESP